MSVMNSFKRFADYIAVCLVTIDQRDLLLQNFLIDICKMCKCVLKGMVSFDLHSREEKK